MNKELINFTKKVFEYYNNKINTINTNISLNISNNKNINSIAEYRIDTIHIYLNNIINRYKGINNTKKMIIYTIIHELYHVDQIVDYNKYKDKQYRKYIEDSVEDISKKFIKDNIECIYNTFNIKFNINSKFLQYNYINYKSYNDKIEYINYLLNYLYHENKDYATILKTAYNISIKLIDKNKEYYIKKDNKFIIENLYQDNYTKYEYYKIEKKELNTIIIFSNNENIYK